MDFLRMLESARTPALTWFMSAITYFGSELFFLAFAVIVFWCVSKRGGYYILLVGFLGTACNQFMKIWFRIPRPWVLDPAFHVVESARAGAGGYSFPSGHTQSIVGSMACVLFLCALGRRRSGAVGKNASGEDTRGADDYRMDGSHDRLYGKRKWICAVAVALMLLVPFSRMYLGCHTPLDVGVAFALALLLAVCFRDVARDDARGERALRVLLALSILVGAAYLAFVALYHFPADVDAENLAEATKNAYLLFGCFLGIILVKVLDDRYIRFQVEAVWWAQILKVVLGTAVVLAIRMGLKAPLGALLPGQVSTAVRYFLMVVFAGAVWPMTFRWFARLGQKGTGESEQ